MDKQKREKTKIIAKSYMDKSRQPRPCATCGNSFSPARHWQKFCSTGCRNSYHREERVAAIIAWREDSETKKS